MARFGNFKKYNDGNYAHHGYSDYKKKRFDPSSTSGCRAGVSPNKGKHWISGFMQQGRGMGLLTAFGTELSGDAASSYKSKQTGHLRVNMHVTLKDTKTRQEKVCFGFYDTTTKKLVIKDENLVLSVNSKSRGGYMGKLK